MIKFCKTYFPLLLILAVVLMSSCREDFDFEPSSGNLEFSTDTLFLDTVFTNIGSSTFQFKVYNRSDNDISIPSVSLAEGENSKYRLNIDGLPGKTFENIEIQANDSIFVFVEVTASIEELAAQNNQFLLTDEIQFDSGDRLQKVDLVTLIQDAVFLFPERFEDGSNETISLGMNEEGDEVLIDGFILDDSELTFTNEKPYVIFGYAGVPSGQTLEIQAGARIHFHENSGIIVAENASLHVNGQLSSDPEILENEVIFEGDRLEPEFSEVPGQWGTIWLTAGSTDHQFDYATIKNATVGILMDSNDGTENPTLTLKNTQIYNSSNVGLLARTGFIEAENFVVNNSGQASVNLSLGGRYSFKHSTIANYWQNSFRQFPALLIENQLETQENLFVADLVEATFSNCIIYGNERVEILFNRSEDLAFNFKFENSLLHIDPFNSQPLEEPEFDFNNTNLYENIVLNQSPGFLDTQLNQLNISEESLANGIGNTQTSAEVPFDILGVNRSQNPDAGAYESVVFDEE
ncbi:hypothetical protein [Flavobacterium sp. CS20]|uniref:hypothetical protein n=1 Tax=Flavobacterium sp. CS20 TaxID=2775246 RepID=UPI001B3A2A93|nr:hypothetical protein [Flavobacterium sp. CS20]QTY26887.1 hypothetical protein IGB25_13655 [Flavobacterium sp. CS20]